MYTKTLSQLAAEHDVPVSTVIGTVHAIECGNVRFIRDGRVHSSCLPLLDRALDTLRIRKAA